MTKLERHTMMKLRALKYKLQGQGHVLNKAKAQELEELEKKELALYLEGLID